MNTISKRRQRKILKQIKEVYLEIMSIGFAAIVGRAATPQELRRLERMFESTAMRRDQISHVRKLTRKNVEEFERKIPNALYGAKSRFKKIYKNLPHPPGGAPRKLSDDRRREACLQVADLMGRDGLELADATQRVAARFKVSLRTMQRTWQTRAQYLTKGSPM